MLPFLKPRQIGAVMIAEKTKDGTKDKHLETELDPGLQSAMEDFYKANGAKDVDAMVRAFQAAFDILGSKPGEDL